MNEKIVKINVSDGDRPNTRVATVSFTLETDLELIYKAHLGKKSQTCKICGTSGDFETWIGAETLVGSREEFLYFICPVCDCLQIEKFPENIEKYYEHDYYSYNTPNIQTARSDAPRNERMILDVGCGAGKWLCELAEKGYVNLYGCDPFIELDLKYKNGVKIKKCTIHEMDGQYDIINLGHSFEHMPDPHEVFKSLDRLLQHDNATQGKDVPKIQIAIPIFPNIFFDIYGPYWHVMDPPRHFFLHSKKSIEWLAEKYGFYVENIVYFKAPHRFSLGRMCQCGVPWINKTAYKYLEADPRFSGLRENAKIFDVLAECTVIAQNADEACFVLNRRIQ